MSSPQGCLAAIATSIALCDQFQRSLQTPATISCALPSTHPAETPSPLPLLKAAAESLKSTATRLSLLTITPPFTSTAIASLLKPLNESILPSLVTATLLVTSNWFLESFTTETTNLTKFALAETQSFLDLVNERAQDGLPKGEVDPSRKQNITEATGRVWEKCDNIIKFATEGIPGFVLARAEQWLALMKDAVQELQDWDPEEDVDEDVWGIESNEDGSSKENGKSEDEAVIAAGVKDQVLKVLSRIPQSVHVVLKQRLAKMPAGCDTDTDKKRGKMLDKLLKNLRQISESIDESAEAMYLGNPELCLKKAGEARALTIDVVELVVPPWEAAQGDTKESKEDVFVKRALAWIEQTDPGPIKQP